MTQPRIDPYVVAICTGLLARVDELGAELADRVRAGEPLYRDETIVPLVDLRRSCTDNIEFIYAHLAGRPLSRDAPWETGRRRAEQGIPLPIALRAYRIGGRFVWESLVAASDGDPSGHEALLAAATGVWMVVDDFSQVLVESFRETTVESARRDTQVRIAVVNALLDGGAGSGPALWDAADSLRLPRRGPFVVVSAEAPRADEEALPGIEQQLHRRDVASAWRLGVESQDGIVALRPRFGEAELCHLVGGSATARVGVSEMVTELDQAPAALRQATLARTAGTPGQPDPVRYQPDSMSVLLASTPEGAREFASAVLGPVLDQPPADRSALLETLRTWYARGASPSEAAAQLHVHRNTVRYRLRRIEELTGVNLADPVGAGKVYLALEAVRMNRLAG